MTGFKGFDIEKYHFEFQGLKGRRGVVEVITLFSLKSLTIKEENGWLYRL